MKDEIKEILDELESLFEISEAPEHIIKGFNKIKNYITNLQQKEMIMKRYLELIVDLGYDYDGFNKVDSLKGLIDELVRYANLGRTCDTAEPIYEKDDRKYNILDEELKDK